MGPPVPYSTYNSSKWEDRVPRAHLLQPRGQSVSAQQLGQPGLPAICKSAPPGAPGTPGAVASRAAPHQGYPVDCPGDTALHGGPTAGTQRPQDVNQNI